jgi:hypothetical protein
MSECFICYTDDGKSIEECLLDTFNHRLLGYPLISLSYAYDCRCSTTYAHNRCLKNVLKCPTCRKVVVKPNLSVEIYGEKYLKWIKLNISSWKNIVMDSAILVFVISFFNFLNKCDVIKLNATSLMIGLLLISVSALVLKMDDYMNKYWLYDNVSKKFY